MNHLCERASKLTFTQVNVLLGIRGIWVSIQKQRLDQVASLGRVHTKLEACTGAYLCALQTNRHAGCWMLDSEESLILTWLEEVYEKRVVLVEDPFAPGNYAIISIMVVVYPGKTSLPEAQSSESLVWYGL